jgi:uncharacterized repeat protein (TIGR01451 family)
MDKRVTLHLLILLGLSLVALLLVLPRPAPVRADANIGLEISPANQIVASGNSAVFSLVISNTTNPPIDITNVTVNRTMSGDGDGGNCDSFIGPGGDIDTDDVLDPGEIWNYSCVEDGVTADLTFTAQVTGLRSDNSSSVNASDTATVDLAEASINVSMRGGDVDLKTVDSGNSENFLIRIRNTGNITLTNVQVQHTCDTLTPAANYTTINPKSNKDHTCTLSNVQEGRIAYVSASDPTSGSQPVSDAQAVTAIVTSVAEACPVGPSDSIDMLAFWKLDQPDPLDDYYSGHDAECPAGGSSICPTNLTKGRVNNAQTFNGTNTRIRVPVIPGDDAFNFGANEDFSIELWMRGVPGQTCAASGFTNNEVMIGRTDTSGLTKLQWWLGCSNSTGRARFLLQDVNDNEINLESPQTIVDGNWHHLVAVRKGAGSDKVNRLYVDGVEVASADAVYPGGFSSATVPVTIGWMGSGFHFQGDLDEIAMYDEALSASEIAAHYANGIPGPGVCGGTFGPWITDSPSNTNVTLGLGFEYTVTADSNPEETYDLPSAPAGMTISASGAISWTATLTGSFNVQVRATNPQTLLIDTRTFTITVNESGSGSGADKTYLPVVIKQ